LWLTLVLVAAASLTSCTSSEGEIAQITILFTNDEHGWMAPSDESGGAAGLVQLWREKEGYSASGPFLVLSGGDTWTGPALSTWFEGEPMVDVMNAMGYDAAAIGNHEFDFGPDVLRERLAQAEFPFLGANVQEAATGEVADIALPYVVQQVAVADGGTEIGVGIVGLASQRTPRTTMPTHVAELSFAGYAETLGRIVPEVRADGADVVVLVTHLCSPEMTALLPVAAELDIAMIGGGHCHERFAQVEQGIAFVQAGWRMEAYGRVDLTLDTRTGDVSNATVEIVPNPRGAGDPEIEMVVARWEAELGDALLVTIGYTQDGLAKGSNAMMNLVMDAWLAAYPADVALCNPGSFRQDLDPGEITLADIVGVLPFNNILVDATLTGQQVIASYTHGARRPAVAGLEREGHRYTVNGEPLDPDGEYQVLVNDYMYAGGDGYALADYDPNAYVTGIDWRQPVIDWISARKTSSDAPLEEYLDTAAR
jgi:2',3'-cyclic-nucleotide 2'-phosphodiesterase (5'-nucleotidase family)